MTVVSLAGPVTQTTHPKTDAALQKPRGLAPEDMPLLHSIRANPFAQFPDEWMRKQCESDSVNILSIF
jgi:hypothetical protein